MAIQTVSTRAGNVVRLTTTGTGRRGGFRGRRGALRRARRMADEIRERAASRWDGSVAIARDVVPAPTEPETTRRRESEFGPREDHQNPCGILARQHEREGSLRLYSQAATCSGRNARRRAGRALPATRPAYPRPSNPSDALRPRAVIRRKRGSRAIRAFRRHAIPR